MTLFRFAATAGSDLKRFRNVRSETPVLSSMGMAGDPLLVAGIKRAQKQPSCRESIPPSSCAVKRSGIDTWGDPLPNARLERPAVCWAILSHWQSPSEFVGVGTASDRHCKARADCPEIRGRKGPNRFVDTGLASSYSRVEFRLLPAETSHDAQNRQCDPGDVESVHGVASESAHADRQT